MFSGLLNLKTLQPMKMRVKRTKSKKTFSFSIIFKERKMVTPTRIIQKNCSRISTCCTHPPPPLPYTTFTETWFARARLRLNNGNAGPSVFLLAEWNTTYDVFLGSKVSLIRAMCDSRKYGKSMMQLNGQMFPGKWGILMLMTAICRCLFVGKILILQANNRCPSRWTVISFIFVKYAQDFCKY